MVIFALVTLIGLIIISLLSFRWALFFYLITALVFPVLKIGEFAIRIELIYSLWLIILFVTRSLVFKNQKVNFQWRPIVLVYALFLTALLFSTLLLLFTGGSSAISKQSLIPFYGFIRPLLIMLLFRNTQFTERWLNRLLTTFVVLSIPISILSICQTLGLNFAQDLTLRCYASPWRTSLPVVKSKYGYLLRSTGVFEYHGYNATFSLTVILIAGYLLIKEPVLNFNLRRKRNLALLYTSLVLTTIAGLFSVSVTFLLGVAVVLLLLALSSRTSPHGLLKFSTIMAIVIGAILIFVAPVILKSSNLRQGLLNQIGRIIDGNFLMGRYYLPSAGILAPTYEAITRRPLFGYGFGEGFFSGNSLYVGLIYRGGIIGLGLWFFFIATTLKFTYRHSGLHTRLIFFLTILYLAIGLGNPAFFIPRLSEWYWALIGLSGSLMVGSFNEKHRQLRVLHIIPDLKKGGAERLVMNLVDVFDRNRLEVAVVSLYPENRPFGEGENEKQDIKIFSLNKRPGPDALIIFRLYRLFKTFRPDVVHTHLYVLPYVLIPTLLCRVPVRLHTVHNVAQMEVEWWRKVIHWFAFRLARFMPVAVCDYVAKTVHKVYGIKPPVVYNGISPEKFSPALLTKKRDETVLLHIGRFVPQKNHLLLLEAFSLVVKEKPKTELWLVGEGPLLFKVQRRVEILGLKDKVRFGGVRDDIPQLLERTDIFVLSSKWEGAPLSLLEAMASAKPIVATAVGGVPELIEDGKTGILVPANNAVTFSQAILRLIRNPDLCQEMGNFARKRVIERFHITNTARSYETIYKNQLLQ